MPAKKTTSTKKTTTSAKTTAAKKKASDTTKKVTASLHKAEAVVDETMTKVSGKAKELIGDKTSKTVSDVAHKAEDMANKLGGFADQADDFAQSVLPTSTGSDSEFDMEWSEKVSRLFILRFLWLIIEYWVLLVWNIIIAIITVIHFLYMLVLGKRNRTMWNMQHRYMRHYTKWSTYILGLTDKRPEFITPAKK